MRRFSGRGAPVLSVAVLRLGRPWQLLTRLIASALSVEAHASCRDGGIELQRVKLEVNGRLDYSEASMKSLEA